MTRLVVFLVFCSICFGQDFSPSIPRIKDGDFTTINRIYGTTFDNFRNHERRIRGFRGSRSGLHLTYVDADTIAIGIGTGFTKNGLIDNDEALNVTISGDLDTGSEAASTWYYIYMENATKAHVSVTAPTVRQGGYHFSENYLYVGAVFNDAASNIEKFYQDGRSFHFDEGFKELETSTAAGWTDLVIQVPPYAFALLSLTVKEEGGVDGSMKVRMDGSSSVNGQIWAVGQDNCVNSSFSWCPTDGDSEIEYTTITAGVDKWYIYCWGYRDPWLP